MAWKPFLLFGDLCQSYLIFTICRVYASKWLRRVLFFHFLVIFRIKGKKGSLAHDKTLFGRRFCCLVIYATLHNFLCICGEAENPRMTIGVQSTNEERKCATRHNVFTTASGSAVCSNGSRALEW